MAKKVPVTVLKFSGKHKRSKKEIEAREKSEIKLGDTKFILPEIVKRDKVALKKWKELVKLYDELDYVTSADSDILGQYCLCHSEYEQLLNSKEETLKSLKRKKTSSILIIEFLNKSNIDNMINKKREALQKLGSKIFLDPTSRIKAVPVKTPEKVVSPLEAFGIS